MASEARVMDQTADKPVEEVTGDDTKHESEECMLQSKATKEKNEEEKLKAEDSVNVVPITESETAGDAGGVREKESNKAVEKLTEDSEASLVHESNSEAASEMDVSEKIAKEVETAELEEISAAQQPASESEDKVESPFITEPASDPNGIENPESSKCDKIVAGEVDVSLDSLEEEPQAAVTSDSLDAVLADPVEVNELKDDGTVVPDISDVIERTGVNVNANGITEESLNRESGTGDLEVLEKPAEVEETEENAVESIKELSDSGETQVLEKLKEVEEIEDKAIEYMKNQNGSGESKELEKPLEIEAKEGSVIEAMKDESGSDDKEVLEKPMEVEEKEGKHIKSFKEESGSGDTEVMEKPIEAEEEAEIEERISSEKLTTAVAAKDVEVSSALGGVEKVEEKGESFEGDKKTLVETSKSLDAAAEVADVLPEGERASGGVEVAEEEEDSNLEGETTYVVDTSRDLVVEGTEEPIIGSEVAELKLKPAEAVQTVTDRSLNEDSADKKGDDKKYNVSKDGSDTKEDNEAPKQEEVPAKPSHRQSNNIFSKVKQSIVKVKKAIIGKSPSSKTMMSENKDDVNVM